MIDNAVANGPTVTDRQGEGGMPQNEGDGKQRGGMGAVSTTRWLSSLIPSTGPDWEAQNGYRELEGEICAATQRPRHGKSCNFISGR